MKLDCGNNYIEYNNTLGSDGFTPSRGAPYQYFIKCGLYEYCEDESNYLRAITTRGGRIVNLKANQYGYK
jgi:hypothetical protein